MRDYTKFYIDGQWVEPIGTGREEVINPTTESVAGVIALGSAEDVDLAVAAARRAFESFGQTTREERLSLLRRVAEVAEARIPDIAAAITDEMGAPAWLAQSMQAALGVVHTQTAIAALEHYPFEEAKGSTLIVREPVGVCGLITPWNWPINQIAAKVIPALATGCTMVLKPSEVAPFSAHIWAEILHEAGVPAGVFNLVDGTGPVVGAAISSHPQVDMVSFTGSTRAGVEVARAAAATVKRVTQELGGKSANILLADADFATVVPAGVSAAMLNSGQTCSALTRMLAPREHLAEVARIAGEAAAAIPVGQSGAGGEMGPLASEAHWRKVRGYIEKGIQEGATLVTGGADRPAGIDKGFYVRPTIFSDVTPDMTIAKEEIFGPVLVIIPYDTVDEAIQIANDSPYGLAGGVQGRDVDAVRKVAARLRTGQVMINDASLDFNAPFGGYKQSGNGREWGEHGFADYLEIKALVGGALA
ncbi:aldehyde dehydrogenase family protein [Sphingobium sp. SCG-1]|uniref:aldehyde dehydrogenase family protein n=1 Tax=Sphingobium sp. SCG-1 TaxID=2072936 RepID=UPI000CD69548|nr:aldehyde dehydrogenase family protein [Sphingobium sp. SCG-1]AUW58166.1 aldehyde dehydrogenase family protein [Sphingobium sp. SCG-1]